MIQRVTFRCVDGHEQRLDLIGADHEYAVILAGLMDGTSRFYHTSSHDDHEVTQIGRCQWPVREPGWFGRLFALQPCGMQFTCTVSEVASPVLEP